MSVGAAGDGLSDDAASEDGDGLSDDAASEDGDGLSDDAVGYASDDASDGGGGGFDGDSGDELPDADDNGDEPSNIFQSNFDLDLYETGIAKVPLYPGARVTVLEALAELFDWFTAHPGTSKESLSKMLHSQHHSLLPIDNQLPDNYRVRINMNSLSHIHVR